MTPPSAKPDARVPGATTDPIAEQSTSTTAPDGLDAAGSASEAGKTTGRRRRTAGLEVRAARRRSAGDTEEGEGTGARTGARATRTAGGTGVRQSARAQLRAAKAGVAEAELPITEAPITEVPAAGPQVDPALSGPAPVEVETYVAAAETVPPEVTQAVIPALPPLTTPAPVVTDDPADDDAEDDERGPGSGGRRRGARAEKRNNRAGARNDASNYVVAPTVNPAQMRVRHYGVIAMFLLFVVVPTISYSWYLWTRAADQYQSDVGFGTRTEEVASTFDFLGALGGATSSGSKDMDILNQFIISQELVAKINAQLDLKAMYSKAKEDPLNRFHPDGTIEDLVAFWQRMVLVNYDNATGLMNLQVFAFDPIDAQRIAQAVLVESTNIINELSKTAQQDTTRYSKDALAATEAKLAEARLAVLDFQIRNRIVDPSNVIANQLSVVSTLNTQLAGAQIELDMLSGTVAETDPRVVQLTRRIEVIRNRIAEEQSKVGATADSNSPGFAKLMAEFERLKVDQDFAQQAYLSALAAHDQALTDAQHKTRYLATYVDPTLAESSTAPNRPMTAALVALIGFLSWSVVVLVYYALRDRR